jgi:hypothetical protein
MYGLTMYVKEFSLDDPEEDMVALDLRMKSGRNTSKQKHDERTIYRP